MLAILLLLPLVSAAAVRVVRRDDLDDVKSKMMDYADDKESTNKKYIVTAVRTVGADDANIMAVVNNGTQVGDYITPQWDADKERFVTDFTACGSSSGTMDLEIKDWEIGHDTKNTIKNDDGSMTINHAQTCDTYSKGKYMYVRCNYSCM